jgi:hypothetical protein
VLVSFVCAYKAVLFTNELCPIKIKNIEEKLKVVLKMA